MNGSVVIESNEQTNGHASSNGNHQNGYHTPALEPIAIVGMALRLPGKIHTPEALWDLIINKKTTRGSVPKSRYNIDGFYADSKRPGSIGVKYGHFLDDSDALDALDASLFSMSKSEVEKLDPQQRMLLEVVWECMENAGQQNWRGGNTGVFVGTWGDVSPYLVLSHPSLFADHDRTGWTFWAKTLSRLEECSMCLELAILQSQTGYRMNTICKVQGE